MNNAGTYGDVTWIIWAIVLPYIIWFLGDIICKLYAISPSKTVYVDRPVVKTVYRSRYVTVPQSPKPQKATTVAPTKKEPVVVDVSMVNEAVAGLTNLGVKRSEARKMVNTLCQKKKYSSVEDLLADCFSKL